jgi:hypothetical protein
MRWAPAPLFPIVGRLVGVEDQDCGAGSLGKIGPVSGGERDAGDALRDLEQARQDDFTAIHESVSCSNDIISSGGDFIRALGWFEDGDDFTDLRSHRVGGSLGGLTQQGFHLGEGHFARVEIGL